MTINLNVKIKGGPRTPISIDVCGTSVNGRTLKFANGRTIKEIELVEAVKITLQNRLEELAKE